jgi:hypothetical protein
LPEYTPPGHWVGESFSNIQKKKSLREKSKPGKIKREWTLLFSLYLTSLLISLLTFQLKCPF